MEYQILELRSEALIKTADLILYSVASRQDEMSQKRQSGKGNATDKRLWYIHVYYMYLCVYIDVDVCTCLVVFLWAE
jgi:hypothetical protein